MEGLNECYVVAWIPRKPDITLGHDHQRLPAPLIENAAVNVPLSELHPVTSERFRWLLGVTYGRASLGRKLGCVRAYTPATACDDGDLPPPTQLLAIIFLSPCYCTLDSAPDKLSSSHV